MSEQAWIHFICDEQSYTLEQLRETIEWFSAHMDPMMPMSYRETVKLGNPVERWRDYEWKIGVIHHEIKVRLGLEPRQFGPWLDGSPFKEWDGNRFDGYKQRCRPCSRYSRRRSNTSFVPLTCFRCGDLYPIESRVVEWSDSLDHRYADACHCGFSPHKTGYLFNIFDAERCRNCDSPRENTMRFDNERWLTSHTSQYIHVAVEEANRTLCGGSLGRRLERWSEPSPEYREWRCPGCLGLLKRREAESAPT